MKKENSFDLDKLVDSITIPSPRPSEEHSAKNSFARLMARIQSDSNSVDIFRRRANRYRAWMVAATVALLVTMGGWLMTAAAEQDTSPLLVTANNTGIVQSVVLPDGTNIKLNNHSKLIYPERFTGDTREVFLEGEGYFDVAHDKQHPFIVRAGELKIKVLGTRFTVNAHSQTSQITTTLLEGVIDVTDEKSHILMKPNQQLKYDVVNGQMSLTKLANADHEIRWTKNVWVLSDTPLLDVCQRLEEHFNVKIVIMNEKLIGKSFTGEFRTNESLESILKTMQMSTPFRYERKGENILLK